VTRKPTYTLETGDVLIDAGGTCWQITAVEPGTLFDDDGLLTGGMDTQEVSYLEARALFDGYHLVLDLAGDYPGLWSRG